MFNIRSRPTKYDRISFSWLHASLLFSFGVIIIFRFSVFVMLDKIFLGEFKKTKQGCWFDDDDDDGDI